MCISQIYRPIYNIEEEEGEREERAGIEVDAFGCGWNDGFRGQRLLVVLRLRLAKSPPHLDGLAVAVKVRQLKIPGQRAHDAEVVGAQVRLGCAHLFAPRLCHLEMEACVI